MAGYKRRHKHGYQTGKGCGNVLGGGCCSVLILTAIVFAILAML